MLSDGKIRSNGAALGARKARHLSPLSNFSRICLKINTYFMSLGKYPVK